MQNDFSRDDFRRNLDQALQLDYRLDKNYFNYFCNNFITSDEYFSIGFPILRQFSFREALYGEEELELVDGFIRLGKNCLLSFSLSHWLEKVPVPIIKRFFSKDDWPLKRVVSHMAVERINYTNLTYAELPGLEEQDLEKLAALLARVVPQYQKHYVKHIKENILDWPVPVRQNLTWNWRTPDARILALHDRFSEYAHSFNLDRFKDQEWQRYKEIGTALYQNLDDPTVEVSVRSDHTEFGLVTAEIQLADLHVSFYLAEDYRFTRRFNPILSAKTENVDKVSVRYAVHPFSELLNPCYKLPEAMTPALADEAMRHLRNVWIGQEGGPVRDSSRYSGTPGSVSCDDMIIL